jgi:hyperosmotically inducible protein
VLSDDALSASDRLPTYSRPAFRHPAPTPKPGSIRQEKRMKKLLLTALVAVSPLCATLAVADQPADSDTSHPGAYVKDSVITTKVKAKLAAKHMSTLTNIQVDTDNQGVVWLSGKAPTKDASDLAAMIAKDTNGVTSVHNKIEVAP